MNDSVKNLLFLLSAAPMAMGGCIVTLTDDATTTDSNTINTDPETSTTTGDGDPGDGDGDPGDGDGDPGDGDGDPGDGDGDPGDGDGDPGDGDPGDGDGDPGGDVCADYANFYANCYGERTYDYNLTFCQEALDNSYTYYGEPCRAASEALFACISQLSCEDYMAEVGCEAEIAAVASACSEG